MTTSSSATRPATRWRTIFAAMALAMLASGCAGTVLAPDPAIDCAGWSPIRLYDETIDALTGAEAEAIAAHNEYGRELGCWD